MTRHTEIDNAKYRVENYGNTYKFYKLENNTYVYDASTPFFYKSLIALYIKIYALINYLRQCFY
jgi:hypothetical protein